MKTSLPLLTFACLVSCQTKNEVAGADPAAEEVPAVEEHLAAIDASKPESLVGLPLADVEAACKAAGIRCRVVELDGQSLPFTMDYNINRLNFKVAGGKITAVSKG